MKNRFSLTAALLLLASGSVFADATLIRIKRDGCTIVSVVDDEPRSGCPVDAACRDKGERVKWVVTPHAELSIVFYNSVPFTDTKCLNGRGTCVISNSASGEYPYDAYLGNCAEPFDPGIIVRR